MAEQGGSGGWPRNRVLVGALKKSFHGLWEEGERPLRCVLMLSGGLDSVALLANVLAETPHQVHAHHIEIENYEGRARAEIDALSDVLAYLRGHYRAFEYTTSASRFMLGKGGGYDLTLAMFVAARVCAALGGRVEAVMTGHRDSSFHILSEGAAVFNACFINKRVKPAWLRPLARMSKRDIYESIPPKLAKLSWSCRRPVQDANTHRPCGQCHTCRELLAIQQPGPTSQPTKTHPGERS